LKTEADLRHTLQRIDGRGYKAYKDIQGAYALDGLTLFIDHVQGDPFAAPSRLRLRVPMDVAQIPAELFAGPVRRLAMEDFLVRQVHAALCGGGHRGGDECGADERSGGRDGRGGHSGRRGSGKSGQISIDVGGQEVLARTAAVVTEEWVEVRVRAGLPAAGRRVLGRQAEALLCEDLPAIAQAGLRWAAVPADAGRSFVECVENQEAIREQLASAGLIAFVADESILPRGSGASDRPMASREAVPFRSPDSMRVTLDLPNPVPAPFGDGKTPRLSGLGLRPGVTLIVGGGYHGKSTLLQALERGVYPHVPGDGREYVVTSQDAVKIRAEDGRLVEQVDISPFITDLPHGRSTSAFSTEDASGSTSQAANILEAIELGARVLLLDEDTSATNFMVRDARMQALVASEHEPITPFVDRVRELYDGLGVSTILVMGGCGDYFDVADHVVMMREYVPQDVTEEARTIATAQPTQRATEVRSALTATTPRVPLAESFDPSRGRREVKIDAKGLDVILFGSDRIDLRGVEQLVDLSQTRAIGHAIHLATERFMDGTATLREVVEAVERWFAEAGLDDLDPFHRADHHPGEFAQPRKYELAAAINRLRTVRMRQRLG
jgi:predicted ABC-class ATPase